MAIEERIRIIKGFITAAYWTISGREAESGRQLYFNIPLRAPLLLNLNL